ncbi:hypothetical protein PoB_002789400 [Plakobranchus ocellatus]|uniref:Uncharacterized protein n=1 Tax=Plakobranchus ocellatus TaxID=259542 RepID=A0AAV4A462_9GAST|nr:hypothetical protein PoB_002789400 [Plakobranchus ocellatus]
MEAPFPLSEGASDVRPGCKTQRIAPTLRQVADFMCARIKEREYFKTCIVGHVNCCLQCGPTLTVLYPTTSWPDNLRNKTGLVVRAATVSRIIGGHLMATPFPLSNNVADGRPGCKTQRITMTLRQVESHSRLGVLLIKDTRVFLNIYRWTRELLPPVWARSYRHGRRRLQAWFLAQLVQAFSVTGQLSRTANPGILCYRTGSSHSQSWHSLLDSFLAQLILTFSVSWSRVRAPPSAPRPDGGPKILRSPCCGLALNKNPTGQVLRTSILAFFVAGQVSRIANPGILCYRTGSSHSQSWHSLLLDRFFAQPILAFCVTGQISPTARLVLTFSFTGQFLRTASPSILCNWTGFSHI